MATVSSVLSADQITSLIQQASTAFEAPATALQAQEQPIQTQISALGKVQGTLSSLQSALSSLSNLQGLAQRTVTSSPNGTVQATATNTAAAGSYSLTNIHLAQSENLVSSGFASTSGAFGAGSIAIQFGSGSATTLNIASGQDTLTGIAAAINQANLGVSAAVEFDGATYHLALTSETTSGTCGSMRQAEELSMTMTPADAIRGASSFEDVAPDDVRAMSRPEKSAVAASSTTI